MSNEQRIAGITRRAKRDVPRRSYRIFIFDDSGSIVGFDVFSAEDDAAAVEIANARKSAAPRELWAADRLIARLSATA